MTLELHATPEEVMRGVQALQNFARARRLPEQTIFALALALEECGSNIVDHGLQRNATRKFWLTMGCEGNHLFIELRDPGPKFDPTAALSRRPPPRDEPTPGGWGLQLVRHYMDDIAYRREGEENVLRLTKRLNTEAGRSPDFYPEPKMKHK
jgi:anti-sigma regulatory factor (Ser/Thr protein kinase)